MIFSTYPTLQRFPTITYILFLSMMLPMSLLNCIKLLVRRNILFLTYLLRSSLLWWPLPFNFILSLQIILRLIFVLSLLITILQLPDGLLQRSRLIKINMISICCWKPTDESLNLSLIILEVRHIPQQLQEPVGILIICISPI